MYLKKKGPRLKHRPERKLQAESRDTQGELILSADSRVSQMQRIRFRVYPRRFPQDSRIRSQEGSLMIIISNSF